jgi:hypothetical protein
VIRLVTFSDELMSRSAERCIASGCEYGISSARHWTREDIGHSNYVGEERRLTLELMGRGTRGAGGWWCWKPYIIHDTLCQIGDGYLVYADAGVEFIDNVNHAISRMDQDIFLFGNKWEHAHWCKRDIVSAIWPNGPWKLLSPWQPQFFGKQCQASVVFCRVSDYSKAFVKEWLDWCLFEGGRLIDDSPSRLANHPEFRENRHDQAILTTLAYREGIKLHAWPASNNDGAFQYPREGYEGDDYPCLFNHHRRRNYEW